MQIKSVSQTVENGYPTVNQMWQSKLIHKIIRRLPLASFFSLWWAHLLTQYAKAATLGDHGLMRTAGIAPTFAPEKSVNTKIIIIASIIVEIIIIVTGIGFLIHKLRTKKVDHKSTKSRHSKDKNKK